MVDNNGGLVGYTKRSVHGFFAVEQQLAVRKNVCFG